MTRSTTPRAAMSDPPWRPKRMYGEGRSRRPRRRPPLTMAMAVFSAVAFAPRSSEAYRETPAISGGQVAGVVRYAGPVQGAATVPVTTDSHLFGKDLPDQSLLVSEDRGVQNVLITLDGISEGKAWPQIVPRLLYQRGRLIPRLQVARVRQEVEVVNQDATLHTLSVSEVGLTLFHIGLPRRYPVARKSFPSSGLFNATCVIHEWVTAWIAVLDHPYFAITRGDGRYEISSVPPGTYRLSAWHERLGRLVRWVTLSGATTLRVDLEFGELPLSPGVMKESRP